MHQDLLKGASLPTTSMNALQILQKWSGDPSGRWVQQISFSTPHNRFIFAMSCRTVLSSMMLDYVMLWHVILHGSLCFIVLYYVSFLITFAWILHEFVYQYDCVGFHCTRIQSGGGSRSPYRLLSNGWLRCWGHGYTVHILYVYVSASLYVIHIYACASFYFEVTVTVKWLNLDVTCPLSSRMIFYSCFFLFIWSSHSTLTQAVGSLIGLPDNESVAVLLAVGAAPAENKDEGKIEHSKYRLPLSDIVTYLWSTVPLHVFLNTKHEL